MSARFEARAVAAGARLAAGRETRLKRALVAAAENVPGVRASIEGEAVVLAGRGLRARAWGTRARAPDAAIAGIVAEALR